MRMIPFEVVMASAKPKPDFERKGRTRVVSACADDIERRTGFARAPLKPDGTPAQRAGRRGSSEDDLPLRNCRAPDLGDGRGLNPSPDEREPAQTKY